MVEEPGTGPIPRPLVEFRALLRAVGIASEPRKLVLATLGLLAMIAGWSGLELLTGGTISEVVQVQPGSTIDLLENPELATLRGAAIQVSEPFRLMIAPFRSLFTRGVGPVGLLRAVLMGIWAVAVWGIFGGAISRVAVVQVAAGRRVGIEPAVRFALGKSGSLIGAPLTPMLAVGFFATVLAGFGLMFRIPWGIGPMLGTLLSLIPLVISLLMALILLGLALGWPLMHLTVAAENEDAADALSRSYSYVNQRFFRYLAHVGVAWLVGTAGLMVVVILARVVLGLAGWGVSLGAPVSNSTGQPIETVLGLWTSLVAFITHAWVYSYFWSAATIIYLILRQDVDGASWADVYLPETPDETFTGEPITATTPVEKVEVEAVGLG